MAAGVDRPVTAALGVWARCASLAELWWTRHGPLAAGRIAEQRLQALLAHARRHSPFYRELYAGLPPGPLPLASLPRVERRQLMARFDDWATDRRVTLAATQAFLAHRRNIGGAFLGQYRVWKSSGTCGTPGIFVQDAHALAVYDALVMARLEGSPLGAECIARLLVAGGRAALVVATGDHFASIASWQRVAHAVPGLQAKSFSVMEPLPQLVSALNAFRPAFLASYPSMLELLAAERHSGRLAVSPALLWSGGEFLAASTRLAIEDAFGCPVINEYGASECLAIAAGCREDWLHVNAEWVMLEPVERDGTPTRPGHLSHTVLLTNLANWVQPLIRYDLGDRIERLPGRCACGDALPAIRVEGRIDDTLALRSATGETVRLPPLAIATAVEEAAGLQPFQVAQRGAQRLELRFCDRDPAGEAMRHKALLALRRYLARHALANVELTLDSRTPRVERASGKLRTVVVEHLDPL